MEQGLAVLQRDLELGFGVLGVCQAQGSPDPCLGLSEQGRCQDQV